ncbi:hypothetical protein DRQ07_03410 [candidate division KSB1 bacterium]|nr:MAG: hypothetical protein DRQ07_03410 [candidate division KSB1 bacterium]
MILAGTYSTDITPKLPVDLNGYILRFGETEGVHDPLLANFLYLDASDKRILLISLDILTINNELADQLRTQLSAELEMDKDGILVAAIHTHSAVGSPYLRNVGKESKEWLEDFRKKIIKGSKIAKESAVYAELEAYHAFSSVAVNRRNPDRGIDPNTPFIIVKNEEKILAWLINYNCHPVCLKEDNLLISADYIYYLREFLYKKLNSRFPVLFFNGGSGDIDPKRRGSFAEAQLTGEKLGEEILLAYEAYKGEKLIPDIFYQTQSLEIPYAWYPTLKEAEENLKRHNEQLESSETKEDKKINGAFLIWAEEILDRVKNSRVPKALNTEIHYIKLGKVTFLALPLEIFSSISLKTRKKINNPFCFIVSYGNGYSGYLADKAAYHEGGYEVEQWHKYAGILPQVSNSEDIFFEALDKLREQ